MTPDDTYRPNNLVLPFDAEAYRRLRALAAYRGESLEDGVRAQLGEWLGGWGERVARHVVRPGETLWAIARRYYGDGHKAAVLAAYNDISDATQLAIGDVLLVPEPTEGPSVPAGESPYLYGLHDRGGEYLMERAGRAGWVLCSEHIGADPTDRSSQSYSDLADRGFGVISQLENGSGSEGTLPPARDYAAFGRRCGNLCEQSAGCHVWVIGNEPNLARERPGGARFGEPITPAAYAAAFRVCRDEIRSRPGHEDDQVITAAVRPWSAQTCYPGNSNGDWVVYFADMLAELGTATDGVALHASTRDADPASVTSDARLGPPFEGRRAGFRVYRDFLAAVPDALLGLPVYITEADQDVAWEDANRGWVQAAYREIADWNDDPAHQCIRALILYRWQRRPQDAWYVEGKREVIADLEAAMRVGYRWLR